MSRPTWFYSLFIIIAATLWGLDGIILTPSLYSLPVPLVVFLLHALALIFIIPLFIAERSKLKSITKSGYGYFFLVALFGGALGTIAITKGLFYVHFADLSAVILMQKLQPIFALFLAWLLLKEKLPRRFFLYAVLALFGAYAVAFPTLIPNFNTGDKTSIAAMFGLLAAISWGASTVFSKGALNQTDFRMGTYLRYILTSAIMLPIMLISGSIGAFNQITGSQWLIFIIIIFTTGVVAILFYYYGLKHVKASVSTICELALPLSAILFDFIFHGKFLNWTQLLGAVLLLFAIIKVSGLKEKTEIKIA